MRFTVDPWDPSYGASVQSELTESDSIPTTDIECPDEQWGPIAPSATEPVDTLLFVDGVRRIEARAWIDGGIEPVPGVFASWAAGVVRCNGEARVEHRLRAACSRHRRRSVTSHPPRAASSLRPPPTRARKHSILRSTPG
jgi:hypothetical protein